MGRFLTALQFLTIIPIPWRRAVSPEELGRSVGYFPIIGLIIGLILAGLNWLFSLILPPMVANALLIVSLVVMSGALHLDGFADTCDGLAGHKTPEERWQIMQDSRVGGFGVIGVVLILLVKYVSLNSLPQPLLMMTLVLMPVVSRWAMVYAIFAYSYAKPSGLGTVFKQGASWPRFTLATVSTFIVAVAVIPPFQLTGLAVMFGVWLVTVVVAAYFKSKFAGLTGDTYGAINELAEVSVLLILTLLVQLGLT